MTYVGWDNREYEDGEMDNMRRDAIEQKKQNALNIPVRLVNLPCESCNSSPALQYTIAGIIIRNLCQGCLNEVVSDVNNMLAEMAQDAQEAPWYPEQDESLRGRETRSFNGALADSLKSEQTDKPYRCAECGKHLAFTEMLYYGNLTYCFEHVPQYDKHQQF